MEKITHLRKNCQIRYEQIAMYLKRCQDVTICKSGVWRIPAVCMGELPASQLRKRHEKGWNRYEKR